MTSYDNFDELVRNKIILSPDVFSEQDRQQLDKLTPEEVQALISIRAKLGDKFFESKPSPAIAIVF